MSRVEVYGLRVDTDYDLHEVGVGFEGEPDVVVRSLPRFSEWATLPQGEVLLDFWTGEDHWYEVVREQSGRVTLRIPSLGDFVIAPDLTTATVALHRDVPDGMEGVLTTGALLTTLLVLGGHPVLHGSAVEVAGGAIGFIGHSGQGKSTMAAAFCAEGARAFTDDVLVADAGDGGVTVRRGSRELRLREGTLSLVRVGEAGVASRTSVDGRTILLSGLVDDPRLALRALVIPAPHRDGAPLRFERLPRKDAVFALLSYPRMMGWRDPAVLNRHLALAAAVSATVPVFVGHVPWGGSFSGELTAGLISALEVPG